MTEIPQHRICCLATLSWRSGWKTTLPWVAAFGVCMSRSLRFNNTSQPFTRSPWKHSPAEGPRAESLKAEFTSHAHRYEDASIEQAGMDSSNHCTCYPRVWGQLLPWPFPTAAASWSPNYIPQGYAPLLCVAAGRPVPVRGCEVTWMEESWLLPMSWSGSRRCPLRSARDPSPVHTFPRMADELWMSQPEFFHVFPLLHRAHRQLSCGFQLLLA